MRHVDDQRVPRGAVARAARRRRALIRLAGLALSLSSLAAVFIAGGVIGPGRIRAWIEPLGVLGPVLYVPLAAVLGTAFVPGAALAAAAGLLFGPWLGALAALVAGTCGALLSRAISQRAGGAAFDEIATGKVAVIADLAREHGIPAVIVARLAPWLPDAVANHAFGIAGLAAVSVGAGHLIAAGPRALAYSTVGANAADPTGGAALAGWALNIATGLVGLALIAFVVARHRRAERLSGEAASVATQE